MPNCHQCANHPTTFIKGIPLCHYHVDQLVHLARREGGKAIGVSSATMTKALTEADIRSGQTAPVAAQRIPVEAPSHESKVL